MRRPTSLRQAVAGHAFASATYSLCTRESTPADGHRKVEQIIRRAGSARFAGYFAVQRMLKLADAYLDVVSPEHRQALLRAPGTAGYPGPKSGGGGGEQISLC